MAERSTIDIDGMHCAACVSRIERFVCKLDGVSNASVNLATACAIVEYDSKSVSPSDFIRAIEKAGYDARIHAPQDGSRYLLRTSADLRNLVATGAVAIPVLLLSMLWMHPPIWERWLLAVLSGAVVLAGGRPFLAGAWSALRSGGASTMDTLVSLGALSSWLYSAAMLGMGHLRDTYFETGSTVVFFVLMGRFIEGRARTGAGDSLRALSELAPKTAVRLDIEGEPLEVLVSEIECGDILRARPGEKIAVDGIVTDGESAVDESLLTGESAPIEKKAGALVLGGSLNIAGSLTYRATSVGSDMALAKLARLVEDASASKPAIQRLADKISGVFVPVVLVVAILTFCGWILLHASFGYALRCAISVLLIACPCALGLATPVAVIAAVGKAASLGLLIRNAEVIENAAGIKAIVFDKTGTLTVGRFAVEHISPRLGLSEEDLLRYAASAESLSQHPIADAIVRTAQMRGIALISPKSFESLAGFGVKAKVGDQWVAVGSRRMLDELKIEADFEMPEIGETIAHIAIGSKYAGALALTDEVRSSAKSALEQLRSKGIQTIILSGDSKEATLALASKLGVENQISEALPGDKAQYIARIREELKGAVAMVGDGVNDAPALAASDVGIAMSSATDAASQASSVVLVNSDLRAVGNLIELSRATLRIIRQNLFWSFAFNVVGITLASAGRLSPIIAALAMSMSSVFVVVNSLAATGGRNAAFYRAS
jgi:Cu+-exporting ATPase